MVLIKVFGILYLLAGFIYGVYVLIKGSDKWYVFPINVLGGPVIMLYLIYATIKRVRLPFGE